MNVSLADNQVIAHIPLYNNFTLEFDADIDDPLGQWGEVLSHGIGLPSAWLHPTGNRLWVCHRFRFNLCTPMGLALARRTCLYSRGFPVGAMRRRVRISLSPAGSFELHEEGEDGSLELSSVAFVPHRPSSEGVPIPLYSTSPHGYFTATGRLRELRLTPYVPWPPPPPPPVPATQTLLGDEWHDLLAARTETPVGEVAVGTDWSVSFELWPRATVPQRGLLFTIGHTSSFWLPKVWLRPNSLQVTVCLMATGICAPVKGSVGVGPRKTNATAQCGPTLWTDGVCVYGMRKDKVPRRVRISYSAGQIGIEEDEVLVDQRYASMSAAAFNGTHSVYTAEPWASPVHASPDGYDSPNGYFGSPPDASIRRLIHGTSLHGRPAPPPALAEGGTSPMESDEEQQACGAPKPFTSTFGFFEQRAASAAVGLGASLAVLLVTLLRLPPDMWLPPRVRRLCGYDTRRGYASRRAGRTRFVMWPRSVAGDGPLLARPGDASLQPVQPEASTHDAASATPAGLKAVTCPNATARGTNDGSAVVGGSDGTARSDAPLRFASAARQAPGQKRASAAA